MVNILVNKNRLFDEIYVYELHIYNIYNELTKEIPQHFKMFKVMENTS